MPEICPVCGLPKDLCICGTITKEQQYIRVRKEERKWRKSATIIEGFDKSVDVQKIAQKLKAQFACGGISMNNQIMLQGDHRGKMKEALIKLGFPNENIEIR